jgi:oligosaccharide repeat unit polymerase
LTKNISTPLNPKFILPFWFYVSYILPLPYLIDGSHLLKGSTLYRDEHILTESLFVVLVVLMVICLSLVTYKKKNNFAFKNKIKIKNVKVIYYFLAFIWFIFSFKIRELLNLGVAGERPTVIYAGYLQYFLFNGNIVILLYLFENSLKNKKKHIFYASSLALILIISQALLGWRGDVVKILILLLTVAFLAFQKSRIIINEKIKLPKSYVLVALILIPIMIKFGDSIRNEKYDNVISRGFSSSKFEFIESFILRAQGLTRLMVVVDNMDRSYTLTNNFMFLKFNGMSSANYIDRNFYGITPERSHSVGGGGVGNAYLSAGILGAVLVYLFIAIFYRRIYESIITSNYNTFFVLLYAQMMMLLPNYIEENTGMNIFTDFFVVIFFTYLYGVLFTKKRQAN